MKKKKSVGLSIPFLLMALALIVLINIGLTSRNMTLRSKAYDGTMPMKITITSPENNTVYTYKDTVIVTATVEHLYPLTSVDVQYSTKGGWKKPCVFKQEQEVYTCTFQAPFTGTNASAANNNGFALYVYAHDIKTNTMASSIQLWSHK